MVLFTAHHIFPFPFREVAMGIWYKYPNEHTNHIKSVDVLDRSILSDGTIRTERLISIQQNAPRWIMKLIGGGDEQFVREVIFYKPSNEKEGTGPKVLMWSINLTVSSILICKEKIRYQELIRNSEEDLRRSKNFNKPDQNNTKKINEIKSDDYHGHDDGRFTEFYQVADIEAQGSLSKGQAWQGLGRRLELWSRDRFSTNAEIGRQGFTSVLRTLFPSDSSSTTTKNFDDLRKNFHPHHQNSSSSSSTTTRSTSKKDLLRTDSSF